MNFKDGFYNDYDDKNQGNMSLYDEESYSYNEDMPNYNEQMGNDLIEIQEVQLIEQGTIDSNMLNLQNNGNQQNYNNVQFQLLKKDGYLEHNQIDQQILQSVLQQSKQEYDQALQQKDNQIEMHQKMIDVQKTQEENQIVLGQQQEQLQQNTAFIQNGVDNHELEFQNNQNDKLLNNSSQNNLSIQKAVLDGENTQIHNANNNSNIQKSEQPQEQNAQNLNKNNFEESLKIGNICNPSCDLNGNQHNEQTQQFNNQMMQPNQHLSIYVEDKHPESYYFNEDQNHFQNIQDFHCGVEDEDSDGGHQYNQDHYDDSEEQAEEKMQEKTNLNCNGEEIKQDNQNEKAFEDKNLKNKEEIDQQKQENQKNDEELFKNIELEIIQNDKVMLDKSVETILLKIQQNIPHYILEQQYYRHVGILKNRKDFYYEVRDRSDSCQNQNDQSCVRIIRYTEYQSMGQEFLIFQNGLHDSRKNTNTRDLIIGRQEKVEKYQNGRMVVTKPNDILEENDQDVSRLHCKLVYRHFFDRGQKLDGGFSNFELMINMTYERFQKNIKEKNKKEIQKYQKIYKIAYYLTKYSIFMPILKKFIVPQKCLYAVDISSQNGTKILVDHINFTRIYSQSVFTIGANTNLLFDEVNNLQYYSKFEHLIANCVYDQCRMKYEILVDKIPFEVEQNVYGLDEIEEEHIFTEIVKSLYKFLEEQYSHNRVSLKKYLFSYERKEYVIRQCLTLIAEHQQKNINLFKNFRPYLRVLVKFDDKIVTARPYYLFYNQKEPKKVFKIGRLDTNHIQVKYSFISRRNTEIIYKDNLWLIRDGHDDINGRKPSSEKTWINLTPFDLKLPLSEEAQRDSMRCIFVEKQNPVEVGPYPIKNNDIIKCGKLKYQFQYVYVNQVIKQNVQPNESDDDGDEDGIGVLDNTLKKGRKQN